MSSVGSLGNPSSGSTNATNVNAIANNTDSSTSSSDSDYGREIKADAGSGKSELSSEVSQRPSEISTDSGITLEGRREVGVSLAAGAPTTDTADYCITAEGRHSGNLPNDRISSMFASPRASGSSEQPTFPEMVCEDDAVISRNVDEGKSCFAWLVRQGCPCSQLPTPPIFVEGSVTGDAVIFLGASAKEAHQCVLYFDRASSRSSVL